MFDFSWSEMMLIGGIALVVIGPKDLPRALKTVGGVVRKARGMAREFHNSVDEMIRESELDDVRRSMHDATTFDLDRQSLPRPVMTGPRPPQGADTPPDAQPLGPVSPESWVPPEPGLFDAPEPAPDEPELPLGPRHPDSSPKSPSR